jgi:hypothetical protein
MQYPVKKFGLEVVSCNTQSRNLDLKLFHAIPKSTNFSLEAYYAKPKSRNLGFNLFHAIPKSTNFQLQIISCNIYKDQEIFSSSPFPAIPKSTNFLQNLLASDHAMYIAAKGGSGGEGEGGLEKHHCTQIGARNHTNPSMIMMLQTQLVAEELGSYTLTDFWVCGFLCCV